MKNLSVLICLLALVSCASQNSKDPNINMHTVKSKIKKGVTSKSQVIEILGSPEMVNTDSDGYEQWVYSKHADETNWNNKGVSAGLFDYVSHDYLGVSLGGSLGNDKRVSQSKSTTLYIYFDTAGKVERYNYSSDRS